MVIGEEDMATRIISVITRRAMPLVDILASPIPGEDKCDVSRFMSVMKILSYPFKQYYP